MHMCVRIYTIINSDININYNSNTLWSTALYKMSHNFHWYCEIARSFHIISTFHVNWFSIYAHDIYIYYMCHWKRHLYCQMIKAMFFEYTMHYFQCILIFAIRMIFSKVDYFFYQKIKVLRILRYVILYLVASMLNL